MDGAPASWERVLLASDPHPQVRERLAESADLGRRDDVTLTSLARDEDDDVRWVLREALARPRMAP